MEFRNVYVASFMVHINLALFNQNLILKHATIFSFTNPMHTITNSEHGIETTM